MATSGKDNNWFWVYFTSVNNIAKCDICYTSFQITEIPNDDIMSHIRTEHNVDYQRIVSSGNSQKDLESQLYIKHNNDITCKYCDLIFYATDNSYSLLNHLETTHRIKEDIAAQICEWLREYYSDEIDTDMKRRCTRCNETILNKPLLLLSHLSKTHNVDDVPLESVGNWEWEYYTRSEGHKAECSVCSEHFVPNNNVSVIKDHIKSYHGNILDVSKNLQAYKNWPYSITENNQLKCDNCDKSYDLIFYASANMKTHLVSKHNLNEGIARKLCNWILEYFHISNLQTSKCNICENMFQTSNSFNLMIHLKEAHQVRVSPEIIPTRFLTYKNWIWAYYTRNNHLAKCSVCSKTYVGLTNISMMINHIKTAHGNMFDVSENSREYENWPYFITENNRVKCDNCVESYDLIFYATPQMKTHLIKAHNLNEGIARKLCNWVLEYFHISNLQTSKCNRCQNVFQKSNFFNLMIHLKKVHQICVPPEIIPARLSSKLNSFFNPDRCAENNAPSSSCNQPSRNVDKSSDRDNLYDEIENSSKMQTTRLSNELSSIFNSDRCAENNAPSSSYNQPLKNVDQSFDCDDLYDQINNPSKMKTIRYKKWRQSRYY